MRTSLANLGSAALIALGAVAIAIVESSASQEPALATVEVRLIDAATGRPTPAMVCITDAATGVVRVPPDGREAPAPSTTVEFTRGIPYREDPAWVGPVRKTTGKGSNSDRSYVYGALPSLPWWTEPVMYQTSGEFSIRLPEGRWKIAVARGMEIVPQTEEFRTGSKGKIEKTIRLERWIDLGREGWHSGDIHVHHPTTEASHRDYLLEYARAEDLHIVNVLEQHHTGGTHSPQAGFGEKFRVHKGEAWLISGQEAPSSTFGHVIGLNIDRLVHDPKTVDFYDESFRRLHERKEALVGYAHFSWNGCDLPRGFPWNVTTGEIDFVELLQFAKLNATDYYDFLNLGFRLVAAAGSDVPWGSTMGEVRTYVYAEGALDPDRWFAALKQGATFVTNGPALDFTVDGRRPGSPIESAGPVTVKVSARVRSHPKIGALKTLRLVSNEGVLKEVAAKGAETALSIEAEVETRRSRWLVAAADCENGALCHSSPVYVIVDGRPAWSPERGPAVIDRQLESIARLQKEFGTKEDVRSAGIQERLRKAVAFYADLRERMGRGK